MEKIEQMWQNRKPVNLNLAIKADNAHRHGQFVFNWRSFLELLPASSTTDWLSQGFTSHLTPNTSHLGDVLTSQSLGLVLKKLNPTKQAKLE